MRCGVEFSLGIPALILLFIEKQLQTKVDDAWFSVAEAWIASVHVGRAANRADLELTVISSTFIVLSSSPRHTSCSKTAALHHNLTDLRMKAL